MLKNSLKENAFQFCNDYIEDRLNRIQNQITEIQSSLTSETKSSAGDKHETGRAMLQLEREKLGQQLSEAEKVAQLLAKVSITGGSNFVGLGSLVKTTRFHYYITISAGEYVNQNCKIYCVSAATPIAKVLLGKKQGETIEFNGKESTILEIH